MENGNPTGSNSGATTADPIASIEAFLAAEDGDSTTGQDEGAQASDAAQNAAKPTDKPADGDQPNGQEPQFTTAQLAAYLGIEESEIDVDEDGQPVFKTKVDGKESTAKFTDIRKAHQLGTHAENRTREAAEREKAAERKLQEADQAIQAKYQEQQETVKTLGQFAAVLQHELNGEIQQQPWDQLWEQNPAQARKLERYYSDRQARVNGILQQIAQRETQAKQQAEQARQANEEKAKEAQIRRLFELIPDWKDQNVAEKERMELLSWVAKSGFDASDLDLNKASQVALLRRAWQHDTLQKSKPAIEAKVRSAPKLIKPGQSPAQDGGKATKLRSLQQNIRNASSADSTKAFAEFVIAAGLA
jgi:AcrR family transcriptional regulator